MRRPPPPHPAGQPAAAKGTQRPPEPLTPDELDALIREAFGFRNKTVRRTNARNAAAIAIMGRSGLRVSEVLRLEVRDIERDRLRVRSGKGRKWRVVPLDAVGLHYLGRWLQLRGSSPGFLFTTTSGRSLGAESLRAAVKRYAARAGIAKRVSPHTLRHTCATMLAARNVPIPAVQAMLGHSSALTTHRYLHRIAPEAMIRQVRAALDTDAYF